MSDSTVTARAQCPSCAENGADNKGDNLAIFDDGHAHCFGCGTTYQNWEGDSTPVRATKMTADFSPVRGTCQDLEDRRIDRDTCRKFSYKVDDWGNQIASYIENNKVVGQKVRGPNKEFSCKGDMSAANVPLFGQHLWKDKGKRIWVTEGEIDCLTVYEALGSKWPVVSVPLGAQGAKASVKRNLKFLNGYQEVIFVFDNDDAGRKASAECARIVTPGRGRVVHLSGKDPNAMWQAGNGDKLRDSLWNGKQYRPDEIKAAADIVVSTKLVGKVWDYPWESMTRATFGRRSGELIMHASGSGMGKSTVFRAMMYHDLLQGEKLGCLMLEESVEDTFHDIMSLRVGKPIRRIMVSRKINKMRKANGLKAIDFDIVDTLSDDEYAEAESWLRASGLYLYDHFGSQDSDTILQNMGFMATSLGCEKLYLDHISIVVSGNEEIGNERRELDVLMTKMRSLVANTGVHIDVITHLTKPKSTPFEEGGQVSLRDFRGSGALYQLADSCYAYERNQQHTDQVTANTIAVRSLKDRLGGRAGIISALRYSSDTGLLKEIDFAMDESGNITFDPDGDPVDGSSVFGDETTPTDNPVI